MKLKILHNKLSRMMDIEDPNLKYEQYQTPVDIAATFLSIVDQSCGGIYEKTLADFGCGSGILGLGAALFEPDAVVLLDIDQSCLDIAKRNSKMLIDDICVDFLKVDLESDLPFVDKIFDITVMNPPFGTKNNSGADVRFIKNAIKYTKSSVFSFHKTSTRRYIMKVADEIGVKATVLNQVRYNLDRSYVFHKRSTVDIEVDLIKFDCA
ncbi:Methyltransferase-like protein 5 [Thelohanellus kitauei]|uniref:Methyltransferase-like protein 5 n=1 Tax=Thelohanellus kitauei TaxID=669202 RepID=A0A0C2NCL4_THEKT|nr:Methyltransferase-like protein 5 [Thelohanellus kitauei]